MIYGVPTPKGTGIILYGDYLDLFTLYQTIHSLADAFDDPKWESQNRILLNFSYDVRKAKDEGREVRELDGVKLFGFRSLWPDLLVVTNLLRLAASAKPTTELDQAMLYLVESATKKALQSFDPVGAERLFRVVGHGINIFDPLVYQLNQAISIQYAQKKASKTRFRELASTLESYFNPAGRDYKLVSAYVNNHSLGEHKRPIDLLFEGRPEHIIW